MAIDPESARTAENLLKVRGMRGDIFPSEIFDEHAWNMMLRLYVVEARDEHVSATDLITRPAVDRLNAFLRRAAGVHRSDDPA
jgi:hypothetical protein